MPVVFLSYLTLSKTSSHPSRPQSHHSAVPSSYHRHFRSCHRLLQPSSPRNLRICPLEGFHEVPLLRDRFFLTEQRAIHEEIKNRCPTLENTWADDDPNRPPDNPPPEQSFISSSSSSRNQSFIGFPREASRELASLSHLVASKSQYFHSTHQHNPRVNSVASAFQHRRSAFKPRPALQRIRRCIPRFPPKALQNLLETRDFLSLSSEFNSVSATTYTSTFPAVIPTTSNPQIGCKNISRVHLAEFELSLDELAESLFPSETDPNIHYLESNYLVDTPILSRRSHLCSLCGVLLLRKEIRLYR